MDFVAIDFETANEKRNSPCSIGIVVVRNSEVVEKFHYLIRPKEMRFMPINIGIHGIRPAMVKDEPEFDDIWEKIKHHFDNTLVVAHNASFDISVLRNTLALYNIKVPSFDYICTMRLTKNFYTCLDDAKLNTVNKFLGYEFKHHDALYDALACSNVLLNISNELNTRCINEISDAVCVSIGKVHEFGYEPSGVKGRASKKSNKEFVRENRNSQKEYNYGIFENEVLVFTGRLKCMGRDEASMIARKLSGNLGSSVTKKTTILVTNNASEFENMQLDEMSTKLRRAATLKMSGQNIKIIDEEQFLQLVYKN